MNWLLSSSSPNQADSRPPLSELRCRRLTPAPSLPRGRHPLRSVPFVFPNPHSRRPLLFLTVTAVLSSSSPRLVPPLLLPRCCGPLLVFLVAGIPFAILEGSNPTSASVWISTQAELSREMREGPSRSTQVADAAGKGRAAQQAC
jgi:hypothetical protein